MVVQAASARIDINADRLLSRLRELSLIGRDPAGGITRPGFSPAAAEANRYVAEVAEKSGLRSQIDPAGNLIISQPSWDRSRPTLLMGSHLDTVLNGGWLDGAYGVIAALEVLQVLTREEVDLGFELAVIAFANEEGATFPQAFWGSMAVAGMLDALPSDITDYRGNSLAKALAATGGNIAELEEATWPPGSILGYLELHIEQGPILEANGLQVGVVDAIVGRSVLEVELRGVAAHAGTTPMPSRADALVGAARLVLYVDELARTKGICQAATVGRLDIAPNSANTIPGRAQLTVDLRDSSPTRLATAERAVRDYLSVLAEQLDLQTSTERIVRSQPAATDEKLRNKITATAEALGMGYQTITSGAGHDAQMIATISPAAMIFTPSIGGVSHVPEEDTADADLIAGARVLLGTVLRA